ncbi:DUF86 domain-containing protein [Candidatus Dependentiae bacterium]|nr:DUF86 domain-containing protein [Candidatus Dependentiae bacterium]
MDIKFTKKRMQLHQLLDRLAESISDYQTTCQKLNLISEEGLRAARTYRDSTIKRFELATDQFWKILKLYLEQVALAPEETTPRAIIRTTARYHIITETEAEQLINMIKSRNQTSHIYQEEIADELMKHTPAALLLMETILVRLDKKIDGE